MISAETEMENHAGWPRGLVAIYLYYEGRNALIQSLLTMIQVVPGRNWTSRVPEKTIDVFRTFVDQILQNDMMDKLLGTTQGRLDFVKKRMLIASVCLFIFLGLYDKSLIDRQLEVLESNLALGDWRHRFEILRLLRCIRDGIAQIVFCWAAQKTLSWKDTLRYFTAVFLSYNFDCYEMLKYMCVSFYDCYFRLLRLLEYLKTRINSREFVLEKSDVLLLSAVMYCIDGSLNFPSVDQDFVKQLKKYTTEEELKIGATSGFQFAEILDFVKLYFSVSCCRVMSETHINSLQGGPAYPFESELTREDEDFEFKKDIFAYLKSQVFYDVSTFSNEEHVMRKFHCLFVDFITFMPMKLNEMKNRSEDAAKTALLYTEQGIFRPSNLSQEYENFLECLGLFYANDELELGRDYFSADTHCISLNKLVKCCCVDSPFMFVSNVKMLTGLSHSCPSGVFELLKQNGHNISFDHFFDSIMKYLSSFGGEKSEQSYLGQSIYESETFHRVVMDSMKHSINPAEIVSICSYLDLVEALCRQSEVVKHFFINSKSQWIRIILSIAKIRAVPRDIRVKMLHTAASIISVDSCSPESKSNLWEIFYSVKLISQGTGDLQVR